MPYTGTESSLKDSHLIVETLGFDAGAAITASTYSITKENDAFRPLVFDRAAGCTVTLPASSGSLATYRLIIKTTISSNNFILQVANSTDVMNGSIAFLQDTGTGGLAKAWAAADNDDTITMNGTTKGGYAGTVIEITDYASGFWVAHCMGRQSGTVATPFSAAV